jgi:catechol 2,3-dioxygenase-like lactoylglutathione lyase family enzyme
MFTGLVPMLICGDVQASIKFYTDVIGLDVASRDNDVG